MTPVEVFEVREGQDRGARLGLFGGRAVIGRGPTMDLMLTDPRVSRRHALVRVEGQTLTLADLGSTSGTMVNGVPIHTTTTLALGDRVRLGDTLMVVLWTPSADRMPLALAPPTPSPAVAGDRPPPADAPAAAAGGSARPGATPGRRVSAAPLSAALALGAGVLAVAATQMPALARGETTLSVWQVKPAGLAALAVLCAVAALALTAAWFGAELTPSRIRSRGPLAMGVAGAGGLVAGTPLCIAATPTPTLDTGPGLGAMVFAGLAMVACALMRVHMMAGPRRGPAPSFGDDRALMVGAAGIGGIVAALAGPMAWAGGLSGLDGAIGIGRWLVPLALAMAAACGVTALVGRLVERRTTAPAATVALGLTGLVLAFSTAAAITLHPQTIQSGLVLVLAAVGLAAVPCLFGALSIAAELRDPAGPEGGGPAAPAQTIILG